MPGKQKRGTAFPLTRVQSKIAGQVLRPHFDASQGERQFDDDAKRQLVQAINEAFVAADQEPAYNQRKLEDWVSNAIYRWRKQASNQLPPSWAQRLSTTRRDGGEQTGAGRGRAATAGSQLGDVPKRKRELSSTTIKPAEKLVKEFSGGVMAGQRAAQQQQQLDSLAGQTEQLPSLDSALAALVDSRAGAYGPASVELPAASGIRRRTLSERTLKLQAQAALRSEAECACPQGASDHMFVRGR
jgi:hypothetical protein